MSNSRFGQCGPTLHKAGWDVIPIKAKTKRPEVKNWRKGFPLETIERWAGNGYASGNIGLLAKRFPGLDIDVSDADCAKAIEDLAQRTLGPAPTRYGAFPKRLLMYGTDLPFSKIKVFLEGPDGPSGPDGKDYAVEVLGDGQQYLIYGEHPDGHDYRWPENNGPLDTEVWELTRIERENVMAFIEALPGALPQGWSVRSSQADQDQGAGDAFANFKMPLEGWDLDRVVTEVLPHLDPDCGYEQWLQIGAALHHQGEGDWEWLDRWNEWSAESHKYVEDHCKTKWESFSAQRATGKGPVTLATLLGITKEARAVQTKEITRTQSDNFMADITLAIDLTMDARELEADIADRVARHETLGDVERGQVVKLIQSRARELGAHLEIGKVRSWLRPKNLALAAFPHVTDNGIPLDTKENFQALINQIGATVRYNVISKATEILVPGQNYSRDNRANASLTHIKSECERVRMSSRFAAEYTLAVGDQNLYNPVMSWVTSKPWDGKSRLQAMYDTVHTDDKEIAPGFKATLMRKWLVQAIAAAASPDGIAGQGVLTFTGAQNAGKTTWFTNLAPRELEVVGTGLEIDTRNKDSLLKVLKYWIAELGELDATFRKSDVSALKAFITLGEDSIRRPYAQAESNYARRTVFGASVNDQEFLVDKSGNRRLWVVPVTSFAWRHGLDMQQLWAEVYTLYQAGELWNLSPEELELLNAHNETYTVTDPIYERLAEHFDWDAAKANGGWRWVTATQAVMAIGIKDPKKQDTIAAGQALRKLNGNQFRKSNGAKLHAVPVVPDATIEFLK